MEFEHKDYGGVAKAGLTTGIIGTALGALNGGGLGGLFGGWNNGGCSENMPVNRYELNMQKELINRDAEIAYLKGRDQAKSDSLELYKYVDGRFRAVEGQLAAQAVTNAQIGANLSCMQKDIAALNALTKTVIPITNVCPEPMAKYNSWTAPTTTAETPVTGG
jgi:hypothetical protein